jgi:hypothetical protein
MERTSTPVALLVSLSVAAVMGVVDPVLAQDTWTNPYPGVRHLHRKRERVDLHVMVVDLTAPEVSLVSTQPADRGLPVGDFARQYGAEIALNANYFDGGYRPCGLAAGGGRAWGDAYEEECSASLGFGALNEALAFDSAQTLRSTPEPWMREVVSGKPWLVRDGVALTGWLAPSHIGVRHPRTAAGLSRDRKTLLILVADGRKPDAIGLDGDEIAAVMLELGAWDAFNLDGGGSSELYVRAEGGVQNRPSDGQGRGVGNHLGIRISRGARWYQAELEGAPTAGVLAPGARGMFTATYRNVGRAPWDADVTLAAASGRPSALWDPSTWRSTRMGVPAAKRVAPGELVTFALPAAAPIAAGEFYEAFVPALPGVGVIPGAAAAELHVTVRRDAVAAEHAPVDVPTTALAAAAAVRAPVTGQAAANLEAEVDAALGGRLDAEPNVGARPAIAVQEASVMGGGVWFVIASLAGGLAMLAWSHARRAALVEARRNVRRAPASQSV